MNNRFYLTLKLLLVYLLAFHSGCANKETVHGSAEFTNVQLSVLKSQLEKDFSQAAASVKRQKEILVKQFGTNLRLMSATSTLVGLASAGDKNITTAFNDLKKAANELNTADFEAIRKEREYRESIEAITVGKGTNDDAFSAVMTPLQVLAKDDSRRKEQLKFFADYARAVAEEVKRLRKEDMEADDEDNKNGSQ